MCKSAEKERRAFEDIDDAGNDGPGGEEKRRKRKRENKVRQQIAREQAKPIQMKDGYEKGEWTTSGRRVREELHHWITRATTPQTAQNATVDCREWPWRAWLAGNVRECRQ